MKLSAHSTKLQAFTDELKPVVETLSNLAATAFHINTLTLLKIAALSIVAGLIVYALGELPTHIIHSWAERAVAEQENSTIPKATLAFIVATQKWGFSLPTMTSLATAAIIVQARFWFAIIAMIIATPMVIIYVAVKEMSNQNHLMSQQPQTEPVPMQHQPTLPAKKV